MKIYLKSGWELKVLAIKPSVYLLDIDFKRLIDKMFNKMQYFDHLKYTSSYTFFSFSVFVVWKTAANDEKKGQAVIDIRKLNNLVILNTYLFLLQSEIIINVQGYTNLTMLDAALFFYQWLFYLNYCYMFPVVTYRGQKTF